METNKNRFFKLLRKAVPPPNPSTSKKSSRSARAGYSGKRIRPRISGGAGLVKNRARCRMKLITAPRARPSAATIDAIKAVDLFAFRAHRTIGPAHLENVLQTSGVLGKLRVESLEIIRHCLPCNSRPGLGFPLPNLIVILVSRLEPKRIFGAAWCGCGHVPWPSADCWRDGHGSYRLLAACDFSICSYAFFCEREAHRVHILGGELGSAPSVATDSCGLIDSLIRAIEGRGVPDGVPVIEAAGQYMPVHPDSAVIGLISQPDIVRRHAGHSVQDISTWRHNQRCVGARGGVTIILGAAIIAGDIFVSNGDFHNFVSVIFCRRNPRRDAISH